MYFSWRKSSNRKFPRIRHLLFLFLYISEKNIVVVIKHLKTVFEGIHQKKGCSGYHRHILSKNIHTHTHKRQYNIIIIYFVIKIILYHCHMHGLDKCVRWGFFVRKYVATTTSNSFPFQVNVSLSSSSSKETVSLHHIRWNFCMKLIDHVLSYNTMIQLIIDCSYEHTEAIWWVILNLLKLFYYFFFKINSHNFYPIVLFFHL